MWVQRTYFLGSLRKNLAWWAVTQGTLKNHKTGGWALMRVWALARDNTVYILIYMPTFTQSSVLEERRRENEEERGALQPSRRSGHNSDCEVILPIRIYTIMYIYINWWFRRQYGWILHKCASVFSGGLSNTDYWIWENISHVGLWGILWASIWDMYITRKCKTLWDDPDRADTMSLMAGWMSGVHLHNLDF